MLKRVGMVSLLLGLFALQVSGQVIVLSPRDGETVRTRRLLVKVEKPDEEGGYIMVWLDDRFVAAVTAPFELFIDLARYDALTGTHTLRVLGRDAKGQLEGETKVQFSVDLKVEGISPDGLVFRFQGRSGEFNTYTMTASSEAKIEVPKKAIREKAPLLSTRFSLRWRQVVRDITVDNQYRMARVLEEGYWSRAGVSVRVRPAPGQHLGLFTLFPDGLIVTGVSLPSVVQFVTGIMDITFPEKPLKVGEAWISPMLLPQNLENLRFHGAAGIPTGIGGGAPTPFAGMMGGPEMGGQPFMGGPPIMGGLGGPEMSGPPMMGAPFAGGPPQGAMPGRGMIPMAPQETEWLLLEAPVVVVPDAIHRLDGFELWGENPCARIVSTFRGVKVTLDLTQLLGAAPTGPPGGGMPFGGEMMGMRGGLGGEMMMMGGMMPGVPQRQLGRRPRERQEMPRPQRQIEGTAEGKRLLLFDLKEKRIVYAKLEVKVKFETDHMTVLSLLPPRQPTAVAQAGMRGAPMMGGAPFGGPEMGEAEFGRMPLGGAMMGGPPLMGGPGGVGPMPGRQQPQWQRPTLQPVFRNHPAQIYYTLTIENVLGATYQLPSVLKGLSGERE